MFLFSEFSLTRSLHRSLPLSVSSPILAGLFVSSISGSYVAGLVVISQVLLLAGTDTSSNIMEWALSLLVNHLEALEKAQTEIDEHIGHERLKNYDLNAKDNP